MVETEKLLSLNEDREKYIPGTSGFVGDCNAPEELFMADRNKGYQDGGSMFFCPVLNQEVQVYNGKCRQPCEHNPVMHYI